MNQNTFSKHLKSLMKKRKISGQKIADAIEMSQKTISRYANGETEPKEEVQKEILQAIAEISGNPEDRTMLPATLAEMILPTTLTEFQGLDPSLITSDEEMINREYNEMAAMLNSACRTFSLLHENNQKIFIKHFDIFLGLNVYEIELLILFAQLSDEDKDYIIEDMKIVPIELKQILASPSTCKKIATYMQMIKESRKVKYEDMRTFSNIPEEYKETEIVKVFRNRLDKKRGACIEMVNKYLPGLITIDKTDWYFLMLVQMLRLKDRGENLCYGDYVGDKVYALIGYMQKLVDESKDED